MRKRAALRKARAEQIHSVLNRQIRITLLGQKGSFLFTGEHAAKLAGPVKIAQRASVSHVDHADGQSFGRKFVGERPRFTHRIRHVLRSNAEQTAAFEAGQRGRTVVDEHGDDGHGGHLLYE